MTIYTFSEDTDQLLRFARYGRCPIARLLSAIGRHWLMFLVPLISNVALPWPFACNTVSSPSTFPDRQRANCHDTHYVTLRPEVIVSIVSYSESREREWSAFILATTIWFHTLSCYTSFLVLKAMQTIFGAFAWHLPPRSPPHPLLQRLPRSP